MDRELLHEAAELYGLPPEEYTAARNARAKALRQERPELAAQVAALPKPSAPAAAINRVARDDPSEVRALVQAGRALRSAQEAAVAGKSAGAVADATREHRAALDRVRRELRRLRLSGAVLERATATLRTASVDPELQLLLERGVLAREVEASGFGIDPALVPAGGAARPRPARRAAADEAKARREAVKAAREQLAAAKRDARAAEQERKRVERELETAREAEEAAAAAVEAAEAAVEAARSGGAGGG